MKSPSIEVSALVASAIITLVSGEWWHFPERAPGVNSRLLEFLVAFCLLMSTH